MSLVADLPELVDTTALAGKSSGGVLLVEEQSGMQVKLFATGPVTAIRLGEAGVGHVPRLNLHAGLNRICDYLLLVEQDGGTHAVFVELKATWERKAREQVRRSLPLLEYLRSVWEVDRQARFDHGGMKVSYAIICKRGRLNKEPVKPRPTGREEGEDYRNITIRTYVGTALSLARLTGISRG